jgi:hypothetical protein
MGKLDHLKTKLKLLLIEIADVEENTAADLRSIIDDALVELNDQMRAERARDHSHLRLVQ